MKNLLIPFIAITTFFTACDSTQNDFVTATGVEVSCIVKGDGSAPVKDSIVVIQLKITAADGEIITETTPNQPLGLAFDPEMEAGHLQEVLTNLEVGDSVTFQTTTQNLFVETYKTQVPPEMDSASLVTIDVKFAEQMSQDAYRVFMTELREKMQAESAKLLEEKLITDGEAIDAYLKDNGIEAETTEEGLRYTIEKEGNGTVAEPGNKVTVNYAGRILDGAYFDTSIESVAQEQGLYDERRVPYQPFTFVIGQGQVIKGWDLGIPLITEGGKGKIYIPSPLGYKDQQRGEIIKPYSIMVFDVEVVKVEKN